MPFRSIHNYPHRTSLLTCVRRWLSACHAGLPGCLHAHPIICASRQASRQANRANGQIHADRQTVINADGRQSQVDSDNQMALKWFSLIYRHIFIYIYTCMHLCLCLCVVYFCLWIYAAIYLHLITSGHSVNTAKYISMYMGNPLCWD